MIDRLTDWTKYSTPLRQPIGLLYSHPYHRWSVASGYKTKCGKHRLREQPDLLKQKHSSTSSFASAVRTKYERPSNLLYCMYISIYITQIYIMYRIYIYISTHLALESLRDQSRPSLGVRHPSLGLRSPTVKGEHFLCVKKKKNVKGESSFCKKRTKKQFPGTRIQKNQANSGTITLNE